MGPYSKEDMQCEKFFFDTVARKDDGRLIVRLPVRSHIKLGDSMPQAIKRLSSLERRFERDPELKKAYIEFMEEYLQQGYMSLIENKNTVLTQENYIIPHLPVLRPESMTTKLRVVFDASSRTTNGLSLNDKLMTGPNLQADLQEILIRFRTHTFVLTADVVSMFRQVRVDKQDRNLQLILWRHDITQARQLYRLNTLTYGTACAPYLAMRCLRELAAIYKQEFPLAAKAVEQDFYMDDVLTGASTLKDAIILQEQLTKMLLHGKMPLRKWRANHQEILSHLARDSGMDNLLVIDKNQPIKTFGLLWNATTDTLQYQVKLEETTEATKRSVLSRISQMFDPLGLVAPVLIVGKIILQKIWRQEVNWDQPLPINLQIFWEDYCASLNQLNSLRIPRNINISNRDATFDIYGFGDASEAAYGACLYAVSVDQQGVSHSELICARTKVAPLKTISLPRLELEAALLLARLFNTVKKSCIHKINKVKLWSDSTITLGWISTPPHTLKTFIANRVSKIQSFTEEVVWAHVSSEENPADLLSRGVSANRLLRDPLWWHGPLWFADNCRGNKKAMQLSPMELERAEKVIIRWVQQVAFPTEFRCLSESRPSGPQKSQLRSLAAFLDGEQVIRVGGRLRHAEVNAEQKNPIVLPAKHHVTSIILRDRHEKLLHCPPEQLLHDIRQRFWPISGRREVRKITRRCIKCYRFNPTTIEVKMGDLPAVRVSGSNRPFATTGIDYAGPLQIRESRRRDRIHIEKGYIAIFVCTSQRQCICPTSERVVHIFGAETRKAELAELRIDWTFIPPRAPQFGGLWEAVVKSAKRHLHTITEGRILTYEEYSTLLAQIEVMLNSRPLTPLSSDPSDLSVLTPAHFLVGGSLLQPVQSNFFDVPEGPLSRWQKVQKLSQQFWKCWQMEYLQELQKRIKWTTTCNKLKENDLVVIKEDNLPSFRWKVGRVMQTHPGPDGEVRDVTLRTAGGIFKRPVRKLCLLPIEED
ncbi:PREDICTED: uncharacterized protein LOC105458437 [Wasmannia auropunctata]|uniref:uncharacterized protein LOC105458437 n=1 Tax=Wasmannia auropunctata TaxID=64793 RepID=UPI0005EDE34C|nr:PREDICTED: uncharacterized protein LOC105458437 [Wasmannia auropunctata]